MMKMLISKTAVIMLLTSSLVAFSQEKAVQNKVDSTKTVTVTDSSAQKAQQKAVADSAVNNTPASQDSVAQTNTVVQPDSATPPPAKVVLQINSAPQGAAVLLNDSVLGVTPVTVPDVAPGNYTLVLKMKGYYQKKSEIAVTEKDTQVVSFDLLKPAMVTYLSKPDGVTITANGKNRGVTPFTDSLVKPGNYLIQGTLEKYDVVLKNITVKNGANDTVMVEMIKTGEKKKSETPVQEKEIRPLRKYSGIIGAIAFAIFSCVLLIAERDNL